MRLQDLEHLIRASTDITKEYELVVIGSQAILGSDPNPPNVLTVSVEADIYPLHHPELADKIDGAIGEGSTFHKANGYYAQGVGAMTALLPTGWMGRVLRVPAATREPGVGYCISVVDLFMSKAAAGRPKDREFCVALLEHRYLRLSEALGMMSQMPPEVNQRELRARIVRWVKLAREAGVEIPEG